MNNNFKMSTFLSFLLGEEEGKMKAQLQSFFFPNQVPKSVGLHVIS